MILCSSITVAGEVGCAVYVQRKYLAVNSSPRYLSCAPAKSGAGIGTPMNLTGDKTPLRLFLCRAFSYTHIMVGWAGAPQGAPVSVRPVVPTPFSPPP
ncbi:hypothetical protein EFS38_19085 [Dickeya undicola]|uniref:Uncharacterized protein n=1 Tax=Dickeya undicola TaxID=1577887 RepID=A0ABX9WNX0_9GAMM|nr:hypothetical protein EFS38_19085 [Dickeya undicola]